MFLLFGILRNCFAIGNYHFNLSIGEKTIKVKVVGNLYIYPRNVCPPCLDPWIPGSLDPCLGPQQNALAKTSQGSAIPRWNRLGKRNRSMKKNPASRSPGARSAQKRVTVTT